MRRLSPKQKKQLSLKKDCRNTYGENDKSSRRNIPRRKAERHRKFRHKIKLNMTSQTYVVGTDPDEIQTSALQIRRGNWQKCADTPLGEFIEHQQEKAGLLKNRKKVPVRFRNL